MANAASVARAPPVAEVTTHAQGHKEHGCEQENHFELLHDELKLVPRPHVLMWEGVVQDSNHVSVHKGPKDHPALASRGKHDLLVRGYQGAGPVEEYFEYELGMLGIFAHSGEAKVSIHVEGGDAACLALHMSAEDVATLTIGENLSGKEQGQSTQSGVGHYTIQPTTHDKPHRAAARLFACLSLLSERRCVRSPRVHSAHRAEEF